MNTAMTSTFGIYLGKVTLLSGILYAYYHLSLKDKQIFGWNRFYLLASAVLSVIIPLFNIPLHLLVPSQKGLAPIHLLNVVPGAGESVEEAAGAVRPMIHTFPWASACLLAYGIVIAVLLGLFTWHLWRLAKLRQQSPRQQLDSVTLIETQIPGTPFSFFRWIFWDTQLPIDSTEGKHIFRHELAHVRAWHSVDKIAMQLLCIGLFPVIPFYFIRKELQLIHEFQADRQAADSSEVAAYATFLVHHALHTPAYSLSNGFYQHPLSKRIAMMMQFLPTRKSSLRKWVALPLVLILFGLFAFTLKQKKSLNFTPVAKSAKVITLVVDPGHGGKDLGAHVKGLVEKDINLAIAKEIALLGPEYKVRVILTRYMDVYASVRDKADFIIRQHADMEVSIHVNALMKQSVPDSTFSGFETYISSQNPAYDSCVILGSIVQQHMGLIYPSSDQLSQRDVGIRVIGQVNCPAVLLECGYMTNRNDASFISSKDNQEKIARGILASVVAYASGTQLQYPITHKTGG